MKAVEIGYRSITKEIEKLLARKERCTLKLNKALAKVEELGCKWSDEEHRAFLNTVETEVIGQGIGRIVNKEDVKKNGAWFDWVRAEDELNDVNERIERATMRLDKAQKAIDEYHEELQKIEDAQEREKLRKLEFEEEKKEWAKDGITLNGRYYGVTPKGKSFSIWRNNGITERSLHCFSLQIDGETIFTSGEFWRCYLNIKNN